MGVWGRWQSHTVTATVLVALSLLFASCGGAVAQQPASNGGGSGAQPVATPSAGPAQQATSSTPAPKPPPPPPPPSTASVAALDPDPFSFSPASLNIAAGTRVVCNNRSTEDHTFSANSGAFESGVIAPARSYAFTFTSRGSFPYFCRLHLHAGDHHGQLTAASQVRSAGRFLRWLLVSATGLLVLAAGTTVVISARTADSLIHPGRQAVSTSPGQLTPPLSYEEVRFKTDDNLTLAGWWIPAERARGTVVLLHGFTKSRLEVLPQTPYLHQAGYDVLLFDFRAYGQSEGTFTSLGYYETRDLAAAIGYASQRGHATIGVLGYSLGAAIAVLEGRSDARLRALVLDSTFATLEDPVNTAFPIITHLPAFPFAPLAVRIAELETGLKASSVRPIDHIAELAPRPILFIYGTRDQLIPPGNTKRLYAAAGEPKEIWKVDGAGHPSSGSEAYVVARQEYEARVVAFFARALRP